MHREYTSSFYSKFVIEKDRMYTENANRAMDGQTIKPDDYEPISKNPIIANFFRNIGLADELGSGVRRLHYYVPRYSGKPPELIDGDVFRIIVPLDDEYSYEIGTDKRFVDVGERVGENVGENEMRKSILEMMRKNPKISAKSIAATLRVTTRTVERNIKALKESDAVERAGGARGGKWIVKE